VFICMPMDYNLLVRKYFGTFVATMHATAGQLAACVGIDAGTGWTALYQRLARVGDNWEDFDYANWDTLLHPEFFESFVDIVNKWYRVDNDSEDGKVRRVLIHEIVYNYIIAKDRLVFKTTGTSSGCAITAELNSVIGDLIMFYCFYYYNVKHNLGFTSQDYFDNVEIAVYGDDVVKNVSKEFEWFSGSNILPIVQELGLDITTGDKKGKSFSFKTIDEIGFLKRRFRREGNIWRAPLERDILCDIYQWIHRSDDPYAATALNCDVALREAAQHDPEFYKFLQEHLNRKIADLALAEGTMRIKPLMLQREDYLSGNRRLW